MIILHTLILSIPWILEWWLETYAELKKQVSVNHFWSAALRGLVMLLIAGVYDWIGINDWWRVLILEIALHFAFFNYAYNVRTGRKLFYLRKAGIDKYLEMLTPLGIIWFQLVILTAGYLIFLHLAP